MKYVFWTIIAIILLVQGILFIRSGHISIFTESAAFERTALVVKPGENTMLPRERFSFPGEWGQGIPQTYLFLITNPRVVRGEGGISKVGLMRIEKGSVQDFNIVSQDTLDSALDYHMIPPSLLQGIASTITFDSLTWFHEGELRNYLGKTLSSYAMGTVPDHVITLSEEAFTTSILPLEKTSHLLMRKEFQTIQNLVPTPSKEAPVKLISYDMTFPETAHDFTERQSVTSTTTPDGKKHTTITVTQSSKDSFTNFVRVYFPYVSSVSTTSPFFFKPILPKASKNSFVSHPLIVALEDSMTFDPRTHLYTYDEGDHTAVGGFIRVGPTPKTFSITLTQDP